MRGDEDDPQWTVPEEGSPAARSYALGYEAGQDTARQDPYQGNGDGVWVLRDGNHAYRAGAVLGTLLKYGLDVTPEYHEGTYQAAMDVYCPETGVRARVVVLPMDAPEETL